MRGVSFCGFVGCGGCCEFGWLGGLGEQVELTLNHAQLVSDVCVVCRFVVLWAVVAAVSLVGFEGLSKLSWTLNHAQLVSGVYVVCRFVVCGLWWLL